MHTFQRFLTILTALVVLSGFTTPALKARQVDVYIVYASSDRAAKNELTEALSEGLSVKSYNSNLLALADYSGKQKVMAKLERASVVVILNDGPLDHLAGSVGATDLLLVNTVKTALTSSQRTIHVLDSGTDIASLGGNITAIDASGEADLADRTRVAAANVIFTDGATLTWSRGVSLVIQKLLGN